MRRLNICPDCELPRSNPFTHTCKRGYGRKTGKVTTRGRKRKKKKGPKCPRCKQPIGNPFSHVCRMQFGEMRGQKKVKR